ncbi:hypothetical protein U1Q18_037592 [Sarracenia purpurea var. burkii]
MVDNIEFTFNATHLSTACGNGRKGEYFDDYEDILPHITPIAMTDAITHDRSHSNIFASHDDLVVRLWFTDHVWHFNAFPFNHKDERHGVTLYFLYDLHTDATLSLSKTMLGHMPHVFESRRTINLPYSN